VRGFYIGVWGGAPSVIVEDVLIDQSTSVGIDIVGQGALVAQNQITNTGGSTTSNNVYAIGSVVDDYASIINGNTISCLASTGYGCKYEILCIRY
jgi:hypothetical protein